MNRNILSLFFALLSMGLLFSQSCDQELVDLAPGDLNNHNWVVPARGITCVSRDLYVNYLEIEEGGSLVIADRASLTVGNSIRPNNIPDRNSKISIHGTLNFNQTTTIPMSSDFRVYKTGKLLVNNGNGNLKLNGNRVNIKNEGTVKLAVLTYSNDQSKVYFENSKSGTLDIAGNINIEGTAEFRNQGDMKVGSSFNNNATSLYVNCGEMETKGFNLNGGKVENSGNFIATERIEMGNGQSQIENKGVFKGTSINFSNATIINSGEFTLSDKFDGNGNLKGPESGRNYGRFILSGLQNINHGSVSGKLNIINSRGRSTQSDLFRNTVRVADDVIFGECRDCNVISSGIDCPIPISYNLFTSHELDQNSCTQEPTKKDLSPITQVGISTLDRNVDGDWVTKANSGFIKLESKTLGFVPTRLTTEQRNRLNAEEGMFIFNTETKCLEFYNGEKWVCGQNKCKSEETNSPI